MVGERGICDAEVGVAGDLDRKRFAEVKGSVKRKTTASENLAWLVKGQKREDFREGGGMIGEEAGSSTAPEKEGKKNSALPNWEISKIGQTQKEMEKAWSGVANHGKDHEGLSASVQLLLGQPKKNWEKWERDRSSFVCLEEGLSRQGAEKQATACVIESTMWGETHADSGHEKRTDSVNEVLNGECLIEGGTKHA